MLRHLLSIAALPFTMTVIVPVWVARGRHESLFGGRIPTIATMLAGVACAAVGFALFATSLRRFATEGDGTLAPWDPPKRLVVRGPYRYVRNPMISGVVFILLAEALLLDSRRQLSWALTFLVINTIYIPLLEEPDLEKRFGDSYVRYKQNVPRLIPRLHAWNG